MNDLLDDHLLDDKKGIYFRNGYAVLWLGLIAVGFGFKLMHWPGASLAILGGSAGATAYALAGMLSPDRNVLNVILTIAGILWAAFMLYSGITSEYYPRDLGAFWWYLGLFVVLFIVNMVLHRQKRGL